MVSTPRSGNTWTRRLLATAYGLEEWAVHNPDDLNWDGLSRRCLLQLHWHHALPFTSLLDRHGFQVVVLSRHPLDVLMSILHFAPNEPQTARWLEGEGGDEVAIHGALPCSRAFLDYATGPRAAALLSVSPEWRRAGDSHGLRYEDLVSDPAGELLRLAEALGHPVAPEAIAGAVAANSLENLRATNLNQHFWQGRPGLWKTLLTADTARRIADAHAGVFAAGGYACDPDEDLTPARADANWYRLELEGVRRTLDDTEARLAASENSLGETREQVTALEGTLLESRIQLDATAARLASFDDLSDTMTGVVRDLDRLSRRFPRFAAALVGLIDFARRVAPAAPVG